MKTYFLLLFQLLVLANLQSQDDIYQKVKGIVVEKETKFPMVGVNILLIGSESNGTSTNIDGEFTLTDIPIGRQSFQISYIGYETVEISNTLISSSKEVFLQIEMEEELNQLNEVVVTSKQDPRNANNYMAATSARSISMEEVTRFSGTFGDVARMSQNYAGVSGISDDRNDVIVRGNSPSTVLWRLEGIDIPSPNHWATLGSTGGPVSMLNTNNLRNSDFFSGAFPAEYGNASSAVFDLKLRNGNPDKYEILGQIGFNGFEAGIEGPIKIGKRSSFIANYRYSTLGLISALGVDFGTGSAVPQYQDLNFKVNIPTEKAGRFSFFGLGGISDIQFTDEPDEDNLFTEGDENLRSQSKTGIIGMSHLYFFNEKTSSQLTFMLSGTENKTLQEEIRDTSSTIFERTFVSSNFQDKFGINWTINKKINAKNRLKFGANFDAYNTNVVDSILFSDDTWFRELDFEGQASVFRLFAQWQHKFNKKLTLNTGFHSMLFNLNNSKSFEPRLSLTYELSDKTKFALGYGLHTQLQPLPIYFSKNRNATEAENAANKELDFINSHHFVLSFDQLITETLRLKIETYYQSLSKIATDPEDGDFSMVNFGADFGFPNRVGLTNDGEGSNIGFELTFEKVFSKGFYSLFTASIFDSKYKGSDGIERNTFFNSNYVFNLLAGKEFNLNKELTLTLDAKMNYSGGRRYTPIDLETSIAEGREIRFEDQIFEAQYAPYIRPDFRIGIRYNGKKSAQTFSVDLQNFIGRRNEFSKSYRVRDQEIRTSYQRGFFPDVRYQILF